MQEFDATKGLFHLFFANEDDEYYTDNYIKTNFHFYLYYRLIVMKYKYVFFFFGDDFKNCGIKPFDNISLNVFDEKYSKYNLINSLFGLKKKSANISNNSENLCENERCLNHEKGCSIDESTFEETVKKLLDIMKRKSDVAVVIPIDIFNDMARFPDIMAELKKIHEKNSRDNNRHIIIITASVYANESLKYFKPIDNGNKIDANIFNSELFSELADYFSTQKNCYIYDELNKLMGDRIIFFNPLSFENIRRMTTHYCLNTDYMPEFSFEKIKSMSAVIYAYYNSIDFRCKHNIQLPQNPKRMLSVVEESLRNNRQLRLSVEKAAEEFTGKYNIHKYICNNYPDIIDLESTVYMIGGSEKDIEIEMLKNIKTIYENRYGNSHAGLEKIISLINKPCIEATVSYSASNFRKKIIEYTNQNLLDVLSGEIDTMLLDYTTKALNYYFTYFLMGTAVSDKVIIARDESFNLYKNLIYTVKELSDTTKKQKEIKEKINNSESKSIDSVVANSNKLALENINIYIQQLEKSIEVTEQLLETVIIDNRAEDILKNMKDASKNIIYVLKEQKKEFG